MPSTTPINRIGNGLSLLANKCAANTFDISSGMVYASMRDQIVRAQLLVTDLHRVARPGQKILIVGAGVAGVTAAACAASLELDVVVVESKSKPFALQRGVTTRMVGPFMYEWPSLLAQSQDYPPSNASLTTGLVSTPTWTASAPITADHLVSQLTPWYQHIKLRYRKHLKFFYRRSSNLTKQYVQNFVDAYSKATPAGGPIEPPVLNLPGLQFRPDYIILAVGMGKERVHLIDGTKRGRNCVKGQPFWGNDDFKLHQRMNWKVGVFGGGDGALQDVLRLITQFNHPLDFINALRSNLRRIGIDLDAVLPELDTIEQQSRLLRTWSDDVYQLIDVKCQQIAGCLAAKPNVIPTVLALLRPGNGKVIHVHRGHHFTKAYLLNRFCVHLIEFCFAHSRPPGIVDYERIKDEEAKFAYKNASGQSEVNLSGGRRLTLDRVAVRFGPDKNEIEKRQIIKLMPGTRADRTSMSGIPLPYVVAQ